MEKKNVLVVVDMQHDFIDGALGTDDAVSIVPKVCQKIKDWNGEIFLTVDMHDSHYLEKQEGRKLPVPHCISGTPGADIHEDVLKCLSEKGNTNLPHEKVTFGSYDFPMRLAGHYVMENYTDDTSPNFTVIGLCTDICVINNAMILRSAFPESEITVDASCCAGVTPERHKQALGAMKCVQINIINDEMED